MSQSNDDGEGDSPNAVFPESGPGRMDMADSYLPNEDEWEAKTILDTTDPQSVAMLRQLPKLYPEIDELDDMIDEFLEIYLKSKTSVDGQSRQEASEILMSMFGGGGGDAKDTALQLVAPEQDD